MDKNRICFDWLTFTTRIHTIDEIITLLGLKNIEFLQQNGSYGYKSRLFFNSISILFDGSYEMGICVEMSGQGCRTFEKYGNGDYNTLFNTLYMSGEFVNITRLDVAYDDLDGLLDINTLCNDTHLYSYVSKWRSHRVIYGTDGNSIEFGSRHSDILLRIYDKQMERISKGFNDYGHWIRVELQLRRDRAYSFVEKYLSCCDKLGNLFSGVLNNYLRFVDLSTDYHNRSRCSTLPYWNSFLQSVLKISLFSKIDIDYDISDLENFVIRQAGGAISTYIDILGKNDLFEKLANRKSKQNLKYEKLKQQYS